MKKIVILALLTICISYDADSMKLYYFRPVGGDINLLIGYPFYSTKNMEKQFFKSLNIKESNLNVHSKKSFSSNPYYQIEAICRLNLHQFLGFGLSGNYTSSEMQITGQKTIDNRIQEFEATQFISCEQYGAFVEYPFLKQENNPFLFLLGGIGYQHSYRKFKEMYPPNNQIGRDRKETTIDDCIYLEPGARIYWWTDINLGLGANISYSIGLGNSSNITWNGLRAGLYINILIFDRIKDCSYDCEQ